MRVLPAVQCQIVTAPAPGAVGLVQLYGSGARELLQRLTGVADWSAGRLRLVDLAGIDRGLAGLLREGWAQLMPHGGPRVMRRLMDHLITLGAVETADAPARQQYPEAASDLEADMLAAVARAASPAAVDLLLAQPALWAAWLASPEPRQPPADAILAQSRVLDRLLDPPTVVVLGRPNVGKSTLTNRLLGRAASIVADLPGTTRDWVAGLAELGGVALRWLDTPGLRASADVIEQQAIELARQVIYSAAVLVALRDPQIDWPELADLPRSPDLWVINKMEDRPNTGDGNHAQAPLAISAQTGAGVGQLEGLILHRLGLQQIPADHPWAFSATLTARLARGGTDSALAAYCGCAEQQQPSSG